MGGDSSPITRFMKTVVLAHHIADHSNDDATHIAADAFAAAVIVDGKYIGRGWGYTPATAIDHALTGRHSMNAPFDRTWPIPAPGKTVTFTTDRI